MQGYGYYEQYDGAHYLDRDGGGGDWSRVTDYPVNRGNFHGGRGRGRGQRGHRHNRGLGHPYHNGRSNSDGGHKPWMTQELLDAIKERNELQRKAQTSGNPDDWSIFKAVRNRTALLLNDAKRLYEMEGGGMMNHNNQQKTTASSSHYCDTCDRSFGTADLLNEHKAEHVTCKLDGCTFTAHPKVILKHIEMQHSNNLFSRVRGYDTPEDIEKWKAERRAKFPTVDNIKRKEEEWQERQQRGERLPLTDSEKFKRWQERKQERAAQIAAAQEARNERKFSGPIRGRRQDRGRGRSGDTPNARRPKPEARPGPQASSSSAAHHSSSMIVLENFYCQVKLGENGTLVGKKLIPWDGETQRMCQKIARTGLPMKTAADHEDSEESEGEVQEADQITDEDEHNIVPEEKKIPIPVTEPQESEIRKPSGTGLGLVDYSCDSDSDDEPPTELPAEARKEDGEIDDDEDEVISGAPLEVSKALNEEATKSVETIKKSMRSKKQEEGKAKAGPLKSSLQEKQFKKRRQPRVPKLLRKLLENDIRRERNQILQVCRYIVENNFFDDKALSRSSDCEQLRSDGDSSEAKPSAT